MFYALILNLNGREEIMSLKRCPKLEQQKTTKIFSQFLEWSESIRIAWTALDLFLEPVLFLFFIWIINDEDYFIIASHPESSVIHK